MFNLIPWKNKNDGLATGRDQGDDFFAPARFREEFNALWDRFFGDFSPSLGRRNDDFHFGFHDGWEDKGSEYVYHAEVPGYDPEQIDVKVSGNMLSVTAERQEDKKGKNGASRRYGSYRRYFTLPAGVDDAKVEATYRNGVLEIHLPKTKQAMAKRIAVQAK